MRMSVVVVGVGEGVMDGVVKRGRQWGLTRMDTYNEGRLPGQKEGVVSQYQAWSLASQDETGTCLPGRWEFTLAYYIANGA